MADVQARREARRRKILENSEKRLKYITEDHKIPANEVNLSCPPCHDTVKEEKVINGEIFKSENLLFNEVIPEGSEEASSFSPSIENFLRNEHFLANKKPEENVAQYNHNIILIVIAVVTKLLFSFNLNKYLNELIFLPFLLVEIPVLFLLKQPASNSMFSAILLLSKLSPQQINVISNAMRLFENFLKDFCVYFFIFTIFHVFVDSFIL